MKKILFTHSYFLRFDPKQWEMGQPYPPLGTMYAASLMRENGYNVSLFDTMFCHQPGEIEKELADFGPDVFVIYDDGFNYLTKMCLTNMRDAAFKMIQVAKQSGCRVVVSSSDSTDNFEGYLNTGADFVLIGEAEHTLLELMKSFDRGYENYSDIPGLAYKESAQIKRSHRRDVIKDLDCMPLPAWDLVDLEPYRKSWLTHAGYFSLNIATTRGCPYKCNWCAKPIYGNRYNSRSPENVISELKLLQKFHFDHIWFCDDIFGLKPGWVDRFADLLESENIPLRFKIQSRADLLMQEKYVDALARAGCDNVWIGAESGSQKILDAMDKGIRVEQIYAVTKRLKEHGIKPSFFIQFGYPGETKEDIRLTIKMINKLLPHEIGISVSYPLPGTVFYEKVRAELKEKANWTDSNEMALMFRNTYQPAFYKQLHRYVHKNFHKHLAIKNLLQMIIHPSKMNRTMIKKAVSWVYYYPASLIEKIRLQKLEQA